MDRVTGLLAIGLLLVAPPIGAGERIGIYAFDTSGKRVAFDTSHASIERTVPERAARPPLMARAAEVDPDALSFVVVGPVGALPVEMSIESLDPAGRRLDELDHVALEDVICPSAAVPASGQASTAACRSSVPIRMVADEVDRNHPLVAERSVRAAVGGTLGIIVGGTRLESMRVGGPRATALGSIDRFRVKVRVWVVRARSHGPVPFGVVDGDAVALAKQQLAWTSAIWGQCGVELGSDNGADVRIVDPPPAWLLAMGCDLGLPASGGEVRLRADGKDVRIALRTGMSPLSAARAAVRALEAVGFVARVSPNTRSDAGAAGAVDVLVRRKDGLPAHLEEPKSGPITTDPTMTACIGEVDFSDGLDHFTDVDAPAGTVEERTLVKAFDDGDPSSIDVFMIPSFAGGGRIGESFIGRDRSSVRNVVIEDRAGVRADRASFALAHELGHVLLNMPGHPDDYGVDMPTLLMDSDAADPSAFGPRRLTTADCVRALIESGPEATVPLLVPWPLTTPTLPAKVSSAKALPPKVLPAKRP